MSSTTNPTAVTPETPKPLDRPAARRSPVDADALLRSLAPVVSKPDFPPAPPAPELSDADEDDESAVEAAPVPAPTPRPSVRRAAASPKPQPARARRDPCRATMDVAINPGEGTTAIYVRVPRTMHVALKLLALQNQAAMDGPTELASIVRTALDEFLDRQEGPASAAG